MEKEENKNTDDIIKYNSIHILNTKNIELEKRNDNRTIKEYNNTPKSKNNYVENNKNQIQLKLIKILFGEKRKKKLKKMKLMSHMKLV